jgi:hypothetical protein
MSRTAVTPAAGVRNGAVAPTKTTIDSTLVSNGVTIAVPQPEKLSIRVANTDSGGAHNIIIRAAADVPGNSGAWMAGQGDLTVSVAASTGVQVITGVDSARFSQPDGSLFIDFSSGFAGTLETVLRP